MPPKRTFKTFKELLSEQITRDKAQPCVKEAKAKPATLKQLRELENYFGHRRNT